MSEDTQKTVSEETIASIVDAAQNIAVDSDAMRQNMVAVAEALHPIIERAGVQFGSLEEDQMWTVFDNPDELTQRIGIRKWRNNWDIGIEETSFIIEHWDGSRWIGYADPFFADAYAYGEARMIPFASASRKSIENAIERLPAFIEAYAAELKRRHQKYSDLREKAEQIRAVLEG